MLGHRRKTLEPMKTRTKKEEESIVQMILMSMILCTYAGDAKDRALVVLLSDRREMLPE